MIIYGADAPRDKRGPLACRRLLWRSQENNYRSLGQQLVDPLDALNVLDESQVSITVAECLALRDGLAHAIHNGWRKILVEGDSKLIIDCVNNVVSVPWSISLFVQDIRVLSSYCKEISF
ncbi:hypothetical protein L3X38_009329 [Prunus dulcis]|uniref:RNase H type-1 domain-containing protein n=1 Tax=Prunus dulcis TaxID=3755 RepID=A0AAD5F7Y6_PRUDU|nr:hypothetical protein L3X38_009329 [Prunus dulcis]